MFLVKCSCGCIYTLKEEYVKSDVKFEKGYKVTPNSSRVCPNCRMPQDFHLDNNMAIMESPDFKVYRIPDSTQIVLNTNLGLQTND